MKIYEVVKMPDCVLPMFALFFYIVGQKSKTVMWMSHGDAAFPLDVKNLYYLDQIAQFAPMGVDRGELRGKFSFPSKCVWKTRHWLVASFKAGVIGRCLYFRRPQVAHLPIPLWLSKGFMVRHNGYACTTYMKFLHF